MVLEIAPEENARRLVSPGRSNLLKLTRVEVLEAMRSRYRLLRPSDTEVVDLDVTELSAVAAAGQIAYLFSQQRQGDKWWSDGWDGYPATRQRIVNHIADRQVQNAVIIGGDIHQFWVSDVAKNFDDPASPVVATEFVGSSISSGSGLWAEKFLPANPHIRFHDWRHRGYGRAEVTHSGMKMDLVAMDSVADPNAGASVLKSYLVEAGQPGAKEA